MMIYVAILLFMVSGANTCLGVMGLFSATRNYYFAIINFLLGAFTLGVGATCLDKIVTLN